MHCPLLATVLKRMYRLSPGTKKTVTGCLYLKEGVRKAGCEGIW